MVRNVGNTDRLIRILVGIILIIWAALAGGIFGFVLAILGIIALITGIVGWCGIYSLVGFSSKGQGVDRITKNDIHKAVKEHSVSHIAQAKPEASKKISKTPVKKKTSASAAKKSTTSKSTTKKSTAKKPAAKKAVSAKSKTVSKTVKKPVESKSTAKKSVVKKSKTTTKK